MFVQLDKLLNDPNLMTLPFGSIHYTEESVFKVLRVKYSQNNSMVPILCKANSNVLLHQMYFSYVDNTAQFCDAESNIKSIFAYNSSEYRY